MGMARLVEDIGLSGSGGGSGSGSDDEFPGIEELAGARGKKADLTKMKKTFRGIAEREVVEEEGKGKGVGKVRKPVNKILMREEKDDVGVGAPKVKARKRVLKQISDNPLLRPFDSASAELLGEGLRRKGRARGIKDRKAAEGKDEVILEPESLSGKKVLGNIEDERREEEERKQKGSSSALVKSIESENDGVAQVRKTKRQLKTAKERAVRKTVDVEMEEVKTYQKKRSTTVETNESEDEDINQVRKMKGRQIRKKVDENIREDKSQELNRSTPVRSMEDEGAKQMRKMAKTRQAKKPTKKVESKSSPKAESDEEDFGLGSDGLSDFIVDDSTFLEEEDSIIEEPAPRSVRRLGKGRRPNLVEESDDEDLEKKMGKLKIWDNEARTLENALRELDLDVSDYEDLLETETKRTAKDIQSKVPGRCRGDNALPASSDIDDPFTLRYSPSMNKPMKVPKEIKFATPPGSPDLKPKGLVSPKKKPPRIPSTPHRPSMDSFWQQDVVNDWNDEYSPRKVIFPKQEFRHGGSISLDLVDPGLLLKKTPVKQDRVSKEAKKAFAKKKYDLAQSFLLELDTVVTNGEISRLAEQTGGIKITWNKKLNTTAGRAKWKRETLKPSIRKDGTVGPSYRHYAFIELAEKVIDEEDRLLNTIAHEFCHLATFMIDNQKENPHGKEFKAWGAKVTRMFHNRGIQVSTKHSYEIDYKYVWECENCGLEFKRHSKSIDPERQRCGACKSRLVQIKPVPRVGKENGGKEKGLGEYQMFVKENMSRVREQNPGSPQKEIMSLVGKKYQEYKASKSCSETTVAEMVDIVEEVESRQMTPEQGRAAFVSRELDFLDLSKEETQVSDQNENLAGVEAVDVIGNWSTKHTFQ